MRDFLNPRNDTSLLPPPPPPPPPPRGGGGVFFFEGGGGGVLRAVGAACCSDDRASPACSTGAGAGCGAGGLGRARRIGEERGRALAVGAIGAGLARAADDVPGGVPRDQAVGQPECGARFLAAHAEG